MVRNTKYFLEIKIENPGNCGIQFIEFHSNSFYISAALLVISEVSRYRRENCNFIQNDPGCHLRITTQIPIGERVMCANNVTSFLYYAGMISKIPFGHD